MRRRMLSEFAIEIPSNAVVHSFTCLSWGVLFEMYGIMSSRSKGIVLEEVWGPGPSLGVIRCEVGLYELEGRRGS